MSQLVLLRHGQSAFNKANIFTGWTDVDLTPRGVEEARWAGQQLREHGYAFDIAYTSLLKRAIRTMWLVLDAMDRMWLPVIKDWRLNERHYGALEGHNKAEMVDKAGTEQVFRWRRSFTIPPPLLDDNDPRHPRFAPRYSHLDPTLLPRGESLRDTLLRVLPCWEGEIIPQLQQGKQVLVVAHGNSLRALVKYLDGIPDKDVHGLSIPTGVPIIYELDQALHPIRRSYLGDEEIVRAAVDAAARASQVTTSH